MSFATEQAIRDGWVVRRIDPKADPHAASRWLVQNVPTTVLLRNGREVDRILGPVPYLELQKRLTAASSVDSMRDNADRRRDREPSDSPIVRGQSQLASVAMSGRTPVRSDSSAMEPLGNDPRYQSIPRSDKLTPMPGSSTPRDNRANAQEATVRIRVEEPQLDGVGTGTIIDSVNGEALVLTCGHLFRESQGNAKITVETFINGQVQSYPATLIDYQAKELDIGLISFRPTTPVSVVSLIPVNRKLSEGQPVFSWGCDRGAAPSRMDSRITKLNRYVGAPNVEADGLPVEGRSGGGLFDDRGELIGVCYAADPSLNEGLYNSAEVVYHQLAKLGLQRLFNEREDRPNPVLASDSRSRQNVPYNSTTPGFSNPTEPSVAELTVVLRDRDGKEKQHRIAEPSPQLLQALRENLSRQ